MPTDRSLNRVKKISRSRFGQQTLHIAKEEISLLASREKHKLPNPPKAGPPQGGGTPRAEKVTGLWRLIAAVARSSHRR
jgi:hypothetical protein